MARHVGVEPGQPEHEHGSVLVGELDGNADVLRGDPCAHMHRVGEQVGSVAEPDGAVVVAGRHDDRRESRQSTQHVVEQIDRLDRGHATVEHVATDEDSVDLAVACDVDDVVERPCCSSTRVSPCRVRPRCQSEVCSKRMCGSFSSVDDPELGIRATGCGRPDTIAFVDDVGALQRAARLPGWWNEDWQAAVDGSKSPGAEPPGPGDVLVALASADEILALWPRMGDDDRDLVRRGSRLTECL